MATRTLLLIACASLVSACTPSPSGDEAREQVLAIQSVRFQAMVDADSDALQRILADDLVYTHTTGTTETKAEFIASLQPGVMDYQAIAPSDVNIRLFDGTAVVTGQADVRVKPDDNIVEARIRFIEVYVKHDNWQLVSWQSTRLP